MLLACNATDSVERSVTFVERCTSFIGLPCVRSTMSVELSAS